MDIKDILLRKVEKLDKDPLNFKKDLIWAAETSQVQPKMSLALLRVKLEEILIELHIRKIGQIPRNIKKKGIDPIKNRLYQYEELIPNAIRTKINLVQGDGNLGPHHNEEIIEPEDLDICFSALIRIYRWYLLKYDIVKQDSTSKKVLKSKEIDNSFSVSSKNLQKENQKKVHNQKMHNQNSAKEWNNKGNAYDEKGMYDKAIECYEKATSIDPNHAFAWNNKGNAYYYKGINDKAIECFDKATSIDPNHAFAWNNKGNAYRQLGNNDKAEGCFDKADRLRKS